MAVPVVRRVLPAQQYLPAVQDAVQAQGAAPQDGGGDDAHQGEETAQEYQRGDVMRIGVDDQRRDQPGQHGQGDGETDPGTVLAVIDQPRVELVTPAAQGGQGPTDRFPQQDEEAQPEQPVAVAPRGVGEVGGDLPSAVIPAAAVDLAFRLARRDRQQLQGLGVLQVEVDRLAVTRQKAEPGKRRLVRRVEEAVEPILLAWAGPTADVLRLEIAAGMAMGRQDLAEQRLPGRALNLDPAAARYPGLEGGGGLVGEAEQFGLIRVQPGLDAQAVLPAREIGRGDPQQGAVPGPEPGQQCQRQDGGGDLGCIGPARRFRHGGVSARRSQNKPGRFPFTCR